MRQHPQVHPDALTASASSTETVDFGGLWIAFDDRVLRPRPWTLEQALWAEALLPALPEGPVLELCSGAGQIGLRGVHGSGRRLVCVDANPVAAAYAVSNARAAGLGDALDMREGDLGATLDPLERFPLVIADPPWVPRAGTQQFPEDPLLAIDGGDDGLRVIRMCLRVIESHLAPGGVALLQLGTPEQATSVTHLLSSPDLHAGELRVYQGGVVLRLDRSARTDSERRRPRGRA